MTAALRHRQRALIELDAAASLGDGASAWAAKILRGAARAGRPMYDDDAAIQEVQRRRLSGERSAVSTVAMQIAGAAASASVARRLRRKASMRM